MVWGLVIVGVWVALLAVVWGPLLRKEPGEPRLPRVPRARRSRALARRGDPNDLAPWDRL